MEVYTAPPLWGLIDVQRFCNSKGWRILRATYNQGRREKRIPKFLTPQEIEIFKKRYKGIPATWSVLVMK